MRSTVRQNRNLLIDESKAEDVWGNEGIVALILKLGIRWRKVSNLSQENEHLLPFKHKAR
jgi:hypothetical protein